MGILFVIIICDLEEEEEEKLKNECKKIRWWNGECVSQKT